MGIAAGHVDECGIFYLFGEFFFFGIIAIEDRKEALFDV